MTTKLTSTIKVCGFSLCKKCPHLLFLFCLCNYAAPEFTRCDSRRNQIIIQVKFYLFLPFACTCIVFCSFQYMFLQIFCHPIPSTNYQISQKEQSIIIMQLEECPKSGLTFFVEASSCEYILRFHHCCGI